MFFAVCTGLTPACSPYGGAVRGQVPVQGRLLRARAGTRACGTLPVGARHGSASIAGPLVAAGMKFPSAEGREE